MDNKQFKLIAELITIIATFSSLSFILLLFIFATQILNSNFHNYLQWGAIGCAFLFASFIIGIFDKYIKRINKM